MCFRARRAVKDPSGAASTTRKLRLHSLAAFEGDCEWEGVVEWVDACVVASVVEITP